VSLQVEGLDKNRAEYERLIEVFRAHDIGYFFYNGGGDSQDTSNKVAEFSRALGYPLTAIGIPKTVDNDLPVTDNCPGFGSVAKYVAVSIREAGFDVASMAKTSTKIFVMEVMGRHAGWIAAAGGLAATTPGAAPHLILFPEITFDEADFLAKVDACVNTHGYCAIVVSEGLRNADGQFVAEAGTRDAFGHAQLGGVAPVIAQLIKDRLGHKFHWAVADYLQRAARHIASKTDVEQAYALGPRGGRDGAGRGKRGHADHRARGRRALSLGDRQGRVERGGQCRKENAARFHHRRRLRHHRGLPPLPQAPHPGGGLPPLCRRPAAVRDFEKRGGAEKGGRGFCPRLKAKYNRPRPSLGNDGP
jgi:hypothetical protein